MAQKFGGKFSPDGSGPKSASDRPVAAPVVLDSEPRLKGGWRTTVLAVSALVFLFPAFGGTPRELVLGLSAGGLMLASAWLTREGLRAAAAYDARKTARRPAFPRKIAGAVLTGAALAVGGFSTHAEVLYPALFALMGAALHLGAFGADPLKDKGMEGIDVFQTDRVAKAIAEAEAHLDAMKDAILRAGDGQMERRVERFAAAARTLFRSVEQDPRDLTAARKYLSVYLMGARDATVKFADLYARTRDAAARADYDALLTDLETTFAARTRDLMSSSRTDLDVEIAVLRDRLKLETPPTS
jgi:5-bromo-4-chloroindolyl phosphate hydrolysis protein